jgi:shikimate dehydrogenase
MTRQTGMAVAGVMGWPVAHSLSPHLHGFWLREHGLDAAYVPFAVKPDDLPQALQALTVLGVRGVNLTIPHKEQALNLVTEADAAARMIGAVNTVLVRPDGALEGRNTDAYGFAASVLEHPAWYPEKAGRPAIVLGAGGAARAVAFALHGLGVREVTVFNRDAARARRLASDLSQLPGWRIDGAAWGDGNAAVRNAGLIVNATSLGMIGHPDLALDLDGAAPDALVADIVYRPLRTGLLAAASARGNPVLDGLGMLMHQAAPAFEAWFGVRPVVGPGLRAHLLRAMGSSEC